MVAKNQKEAIKIYHCTDFLETKMSLESGLHFLKLITRLYYNADYTVICSNHFTNDSFWRTSSGKAYLRPHAIPSIFPWTSSSEQPSQHLFSKKQPSSQNKRLINVHKTARSAINRAHNYQQNKALKLKKALNLKPLLKFRKINIDLEPILVKLTSINQYITCFLCGGYLVDASTVTECLHTFCKSCIVFHIQRHFTCPVCDILIHETNPLSNIRFDRTKQDIIYKILPQIPKEEHLKAVAFYKSRNLPMPESNEGSPDKHASTRSASPVDELVSLMLEFSGASVECRPIQPLSKKFVRVPGRATIKHLQRFLTKKLSLSDDIIVDIVCSEDDEIIEEHTTLWSIIHEMNIEKEALITLYYSFSVINNKIS
ncbi:polycomb group RING finger protein 3-like isoform X2 [Antedon mediterranea]|uniref:polycomb group RING finger protein 3-like isoform X2 n=1 Tax=Antedon mediterranea TaxID=105859 RepID=UPI003AF98F6E